MAIVYPDDGVDQCLNRLQMWDIEVSPESHTQHLLNYGHDWRLLLEVVYGVANIGQIFVGQSDHDFQLAVVGTWWSLLVNTTTMVRKKVYKKYYDTTRTRFIRL